MIEEIRLAGITPFSSCAFPGKSAAVFLLQGCNGRCAHCQHSWIRPHECPPDSPTWPDALTWLADRRGLLDGVVIRGGEPLLQTDLPVAIGEMHGMGFDVALDCCGAAPTQLAELLPSLAWVSLAFRLPFSRHDDSNRLACGEDVRASMQALARHGGSYEIVTEVDGALHGPDTLAEMLRDLLDCGIPREHWVLQACRDDQGRQCAEAQQLAERCAQHLGIRCRNPS